MSEGATYPATGLVDVDWAGRRVRIEHARVGVDDPRAPTMVFLHEGLGSVSMWKDFPRRLCEAVGLRGLVFSRPGYGRSTPRAPGERWAPDFMHRQALDLLPALLAALGVDAATEPPCLFGHSDGGSIALIHAARFPARVAGLVVVAPHILVEDVSVASIERVRDEYAQGDLKRGLARHHDDPDSAFGGWSGAWLDPAFRAWSIESELASIRCPVLAIQGTDDEYGTLEQVRGIARRVPGTELLELPGCGHTPHRDRPEVLIEAVERFVRSRTWAGAR
ncbi:MAG: alpha/beta hydrolase [Burkholderiaceae bacterium]|nr:alpha/beta hydrolase [Burkholderiales bacterium]MCZ8337832.1 alpha/beta hydrolase [Burkholderiaceae bacterium]